MIINDYFKLTNAHSMYLSNTFWKIISQTIFIFYLKYYFSQQCLKSIKMKMLKRTALKPEVHNSWLERVRQNIPVYTRQGKYTHCQSIHAYVTFFPETPVGSNSLFKTRLKIWLTRQILFSCGSETLRAATLWENVTTNVTVITTWGHHGFRLYFNRLCTGFRVFFLLFSASLFSLSTLIERTFQFKADKIREHRLIFLIAQSKK